MAIPQFSVCGIQELPGHANAGVTHILSLLDPEYLELDVFHEYGAHERIEFRFNDIIEPIPGYILPRREDMAAIIALGRKIIAPEKDASHFLVHCHQGVSRSTAVMAAMLADAHVDREADEIFALLREIRPQAWPNSLMMHYADDILGRRGELMAALARHYAFQLKALPHYREWMTSLGRGKEVSMGLNQVTQV